MFIAAAPFQVCFSQNLKYEASLDLPFYNRRGDDCCCHFVP